MSDVNKTYSYRCGEKIELVKSTDQIIMRQLPAIIDDNAIVYKEQVSAASTRLLTTETDLEPLMQRCRIQAPTHHAYFEARSGSEFLISDRIFVTFKDELDDSQVDLFAGQYGLVKKNTYGPREYLFQLTNHTGMNPVKLVVLLTENEPLVELAEHDLNQRMQKFQFSPPQDPDYVRQWHLHTSLNNPDYDIRSSSRCEEAWGLLDSFGSEEVVIAVSDDGCKLDHFDFDSPGKFAGWGYFQNERLVNATDIDADPRRMYIRGANHGTSCNGVIGGEPDAVLTVGAAAGCRLLPVQWESSGPSLFISDSKLLTALSYIADKADVMSNSWGGVPTTLWAIPVINRLTSLAISGGRRGRGIVFLWAAGNENCLIDYTADQDVPYDHGIAEQGGAPVWVGVNTTRVFRNNLVGIPGLMHVAALASTGKRSHYSNYGPGISLCAPSSNSHTYYRMTVRGLGITTATGEPGGVTDNFGGTSSATPLVAGIAALTVSANPDLSATEVVSILKQTAAKDLDFSPYPKTPPANFDNDTRWDVSPIPPFDDGAFTDQGYVEGTWSPWFGHGRVDAKAAVAEAMSRRSAGASQGLLFSEASSPDKSIPDNNSRGIRDKLTCQDDFTIASIKVTLNVKHSYIGDLLITLESPSGLRVILHNREGASMNDLHIEYDANLIPALQNFTGESTQGDWQLHIQDLASADRGRLIDWSLSISGQAVAQIIAEESVGVIIPDNLSAGLDRSLTISDVGLLDSIRIDLDITHSYIGDLVVEIISPDNISVLLHKRSGGSSDNIIKSYTMNNTSLLSRLRGSTISGDWRLRVSDHAGADQGKLNHWGLRITPVA